jgi:hypothetical protein
MYEVYLPLILGMFGSPGGRALTPRLDKVMQSCVASPSITMVWLRGFSAAGYVRATDATPALIAESQVIGRIARLAAARQLGWAYLADRIGFGPARK